jgi:hypothetical protein
MGPYDPARRLQPSSGPTSESRPRQCPDNEVGIAHAVDKGWRLFPSSARAGNSSTRDALCCGVAAARLRCNWAVIYRATLAHSLGVLVSPGRPRSEIQDWEVDVVRRKGRMCDDYRSREIGTCTILSSSTGCPGPFRAMLKQMEKVVTGDFGGPAAVQIDLGSLASPRRYLLFHACWCGQHLTAAES